MDKSAILPEGYSMEVLRADQWEEALPIALEQYAKGEPLAAMLHLKTEELKEVLLDVIKGWIAGGFSVAVRCQKTGEIVAVLLGKIITEDNCLTWGIVEATTDNTRKYIHIGRVIESSINIFQQDEQIKVALEHALISVHENHRGRRLGIAMAQKLDEMGRDYGCQASIVAASNVATMKVYQKLGYRVIHEIDYETFIIDGKRVCNIEAGNGTKSICLMKKMPI